MTALKVAIADDHILLRNGLAGLIRNLGYQISAQCNNGKELIAQVSLDPPDIILMDINMPVMDGFDATLWLSEHYPLIPVLGLSMYDDEKAIVQLLKNGAKGYILKDSEPEELQQAITSILQKGYYYSEIVTGKLVHSINSASGNNHSGPKKVDLTPKEKLFLKLAATELTYKEIAKEMHLSPRTIDGYRDALFEKLDIRSRVGLVLFAIKEGILRIN